MVVPLLGKTLEVEDSPGMVCLVRQASDDKFDEMMFLHFVNGYQNKLSQLAIKILSTKKYTNGWF